MNSSKTPLWIQRLNWNQRYRLDMSSTSNKRDKICFYLVHNVSPATNDFYFTISSLMLKFHCSRSTVIKALRTLRSIEDLRVSQHHIHFRQYKGWERGENYEN